MAFEQPPVKFQSYTYCQICQDHFELGTFASPVERKSLIAWNYFVFHKINCGLKHASVIFTDDLISYCGLCLWDRELKKKRGSFFLICCTVIALYHHNYHMYTVQISLFQVFPTVIIQTCGSVFCRKFRHLLHYAALFHRTKTMHALASQFASLLGSIWPCSYLL